jgi:hypothetical protein|tara:strand:- start:18997 stop:19134 length:138 start_codon:yes stop_codon:yes gene_type:complete
MRNPLPDLIITLVVLSAIFVAVHSYYNFDNPPMYYDNIQIFKNIG